MIRFFLFPGIFLLILGWCSEYTPAQIVGKTESCNSMAQIPDYEQLFSPANLRSLPEGVSENELIEAFCTACQGIDQRLTEVSELQKKEQTEDVKKRIELLENQTFTLYRQAMNWIGIVWRLAPQKTEVTRFMFFLLAGTLADDQYEAAYVLSRELMEQNAYKQNPVLYNMAGISAFMMNKFDVARLYFEQAQKHDSLTGTAGVYLDLIPYYTQAWKTEQALRKQEALKGKNVRILIQTTRGEIEAELFEESAPETVHAFLKLVQDGVYDGDAFSTVLGGLFARTERVVPGVEIPDEFLLPTVRKHFRGSLVMSHGNAPNTGHSQFFIMLAPAPQLDGKYTVFGRVTRGIEVVAALNRIDLMHPETVPEGVVPDRILSIKKF